MHKCLRIAPQTVGLAMLLVCAPAGAQEDKFAGCPDPEAAKQYVKKCLGENPYNTKEVCEQRALESVCTAGAKKDKDKQ